MSRANLTDVLEAIELVCGDDFCEELACSDADRKLRGRIAVAHEKLAAIYRLAHGFNRRISCYHVHENWRKELAQYQQISIRHLQSDHDSESLRVGTQNQVPTEHDCDK